MRPRDAEEHFVGRSVSRERCSAAANVSVSTFAPYSTCIDMKPCVKSTSIALAPVRSTGRVFTALAPAVFGAVCASVGAPSIRRAARERRTGRFTKSPTGLTRRGGSVRWKLPAYFTDRP